MVSCRFLDPVHLVLLFWVGFQLDSLMGRHLFEKKRFILFSMTIDNLVASVICVQNKDWDAPWYQPKLEFSEPYFALTAKPKAADSRDRTVNMF